MPTLILLGKEELTKIQMDFNKITIEQLKQAQLALNNRPRKVLGYKTPGEIMNQEINNYAA